MVSFQRITLSFLLVSGALFAYLIPLLPAYFCNPPDCSRNGHLHSKQNAYSP